AGATSSSYSISAASTSDNGSQFTVQISNCVGTVVSSSALLTVNSPTYLLSLSSSTLNFGTVNLSTIQTQNVTVTNSGTGNIAISGISSSGPGFNANGISSGTVLAAGQSAVLSVAFSPAATGSVTGNISSASN